MLKLMNYGKENIMSVLITDFNNEGTVTASGLINFHSRKLHFDYDGENVKINSGYLKH